MKLAKALGLLIFIAIAELSLASATVPLLQNPDFEQPDAGNRSLPGHWNKTTDWTIFSLDSDVRYQGERSVKIMRQPDTRFGGVAQSVAAQPLIGKAVLLRARLKGNDIGKGDVGLWLRANDNTGKNIGFAHSYGKPVVGTTDWLMRQTILIVPKGADRLIAGAAMAADGTLWMDSVELQEVTLTDVPPPSDIAREYLDSAIIKIRSNALNRAKVDWSQVTREAGFMVSGAETTAETYPAIRYVLKSLQDNHSHLTLPSAVQAGLKNTSVDDFNLLSDTVAGKGYVAVPTYGGVNPVRMQSFADELHSRIAKLAVKNPCGWIVDLRGNGGGNMYPMIAGLVSLLADDLPETTLGYFVSPDAKLPWRLSEGGVEWAGKSIRTVALKESLGINKAYVAVLTGPRTASSGEAVAVSFRERPNTRSFGEATKGLSTGNESILLSDGAMLQVTSVVFADRKGNTYGGKIEPDVKIASATGNVPLVDDPIIRAAVKWLDSSASCRKPQADQP